MTKPNFTAADLIVYPLVVILLGGMFVAIVLSAADQANARDTQTTSQVGQ